MVTLYKNPTKWFSVNCKRINLWVKQPTSHFYQKHENKKWLDYSENTWPIHLHTLSHNKSHASFFKSLRDMELKYKWIGQVFAIIIAAQERQLCASLTFTFQYAYLIIILCFINTSAEWEQSKPKGAQCIYTSALSSVCIIIRALLLNQWHGRLAGYHFGQENRSFST